MSEHDGTQASTKRRRNRQTGKRNGTQVSVMQRPTNNDKELWKAYWKEQGQPWRTEPEIDIDRQRFLEKCLTVIPGLEQNRPDIKQKLYPFKDIALSRPDVEWLLSTYKDSLDLHGADLHETNLHGLPLVRVNLSEAHLEGVDLQWAHLEGAYLSGAFLQGANLQWAHLVEAQ